VNATTATTRAHCHSRVRAASASDTPAPMYAAPKKAAVSGALIVHAQKSAVRPGAAKSARPVL
jgi:hypothetical protein